MREWFVDIAPGTGLHNTASCLVMVSVMVSVANRIFWVRVRTTLTCDHTDKCLECLEGLYWFSKVVAVDIPPISMTLHIRISYLGMLPVLLSRS